LLLFGVLLLGMAARRVEADKGAKAEQVLKLMSMDREACTLTLSWPWGAMAVNHVLFDDHRGPFKAFVESSAKRVRVTFDGWSNQPFVASAEKLRIIYWVTGKKEIDCVADLISGGAVRVRPVGRPVTEAKRVVIGLGKRTAEGASSVSVEGSSD
jgi:hypothetical protein